MQCDKGDRDNPDMRARLLICDVNKTGKEDAFFASTAPGENGHKCFLCWPNGVTRFGIVVSKFHSDLALSMCGINNNLNGVLTQ